MNRLIDDTTENLMEVLRGAGEEEVRDFLREHFAQGRPTFVQYMDALISQKGMKRQEVILRADLPQKYGYKLLTGEAHTTDRDKLLRLCLALELSLKQTQRVLRLYGMNELYPKDPRDVVLIAAIGRRQWDIHEISRELQASGLETLVGFSPELGEN